MLQGKAQEAEVSFLTNDTYLKQGKININNINNILDT
jgi:hypothetical protein